MLQCSAPEQEVHLVAVRLRSLEYGCTELSVIKRSQPLQYYNLNMQ